MFDLEEQLIKSSAVKPGMPLVMGILNVTPDSFSDGGLFVETSEIEKQVVAMLESGVDIIDVGGESTRPGADKVELSVELERVLPVIEWIKARFDVPISIDTYKTDVMRHAVEAGAELVNDVNALQADGAVDFVAQSGVTACLMHIKGLPKSMQVAPAYEDVLLEVQTFLQTRADACLAAGIAKEKIILDPGFGFGKTLEHNTTLFTEMSELVDMGYPLLVGVSRKRMIGDILDVAVDKRANGSVAAAILAGMKGAKIVRVHDVLETVEACKVISKLL